MKKLLKRLVRLDFILVLLVLLSLYVGAPTERIMRQVPIVFSLPSDTLCLTPSDIGVHTSRVIDVLSKNTASAANLAAALESAKLQARVFYAVILAGLASLLFTQVRRKRSGVGLILLGLITLMYLLDVHLEDLGKRHTEASQTFGAATDSLVNALPNSRTWYEVRFDSLWHQLNCAKHKSVQRKIQAFLHPGLEQILYYIVPWLVVYISIRRWIPQGSLPKRK